VPIKRVYGKQAVNGG